MANLGEIDVFVLGGGQAHERRRHRRKSVLSEMGELVLVSLDSERGLLLTVCASGISVQGQAQLAPGRRLPVQFSLPFNGGDVRAACDVVWARDNCEAGLKFLSMAEADARTLENWLALHAAEPEDVMAEAAAASIPSAGAVPVPTAFADLAESIEKLIAPEAEQPPVSESAPAEAVPSAENEVVAETTTLEELLPQTVMQARALTQAEGAALVLSGEEGLICRASIGSAPALGSRLRPDSGLSGECFRLGEVVRCDDVRDDSRVNAAVAQRLQSRSILIVPIRVNGSTRGVLQVLSSRPFSFTAQHAATLGHLAEGVGSCLGAQEEEETEPVGAETASATESISVPCSEVPCSEQSVSATAAEQASEAAADSMTESAEAAEGSSAALAEQTDSESFETSEEEPRSTAGLRRYGTIGALGLLTVGSLLLIMIRSPQPSRAALPTATVQPASVSTPVAHASVVRPAAPDAGETIPSKQLIGEAKPAKAAKYAAAQPKPKAAEKGPSAIVENRSPMSVRGLRTPPSPNEAHVASSAPMTAGLAAPMPTLVAPSSNLVRQSAGVERGRAISQPKPVYPQAALRSGIEGSVVVAATIGADGKVKRVRVVSGPPLLGQAAVDAVTQWRYQPSYLDGTAVEVDSTITLNFKRP